MPVTGNNLLDNSSQVVPLYQRDQYAKNILGRTYWDFRDNSIFSLIPDSSQSILDAGCGEGITLEKLCKRFPEKNIVGIDQLDENIAICNNYGLPVRQDDLMHLSLDTHSIDCCILAEVIEHICDYGKVLQEMNRILKKNGACIIVFPNDLTFKVARLATFKFKEAFYDPGHVMQWTPKNMRKALQNYGFKVMKIKAIPFPLWPFCLHGIALAVKE